MKLTKTVCLFFALANAATYAQSPFDVPRASLSVQPSRPHTAASSTAAVYPNEFRSIDGTGNNPIDPLLGSASVPLLRMMGPDFGDGLGTPAGANEPSPRLISNLVVAQDHDIFSVQNASDYLWQWGQFIDHDMDLTPTATPAEAMNIPVPPGDPQFDPNNTGTQTIGMDRSFCSFINGVRQQMNVNTAFLDASQVYGSDEARAHELRTLDGTGRLKTSAGNLMPFNVNHFPNAPTTDASLFLAGDVRSNEQVGLTAIHTLFVREHNYWADLIRTTSKGMLTDDAIYYRARAIVGAEMQIITYRDFIPLMLGPNALPPYTGYHPEVNPGIANEFSTAAFRVGHTMLSATLRRLDANNQSIGDLSLADSFFNPAQISGPGIEPYLRGLAKQIDQEVDSYIVDGVRNFLFGPPGAGGFDLASLNVQRGRDHGLARYNALRVALGLSRKARFSGITSDPIVREKLTLSYNSADDVDVWVGGLSENHVNGGLVGELFFTILRDQFIRLRDGDRFWYQTYLPPAMVQTLEAQPLSAIIKRNTPIGQELQADVFRVAP